MVKVFSYMMFVGTELIPLFFYLNFVGCPLADMGWSDYAGAVIIGLPASSQSLLCCRHRGFSLIMSHFKPSGFEEVSIPL
jgi:hypothetical protein